MIRKLVALSVDTALAESQRYWLSELFEKGFAGYGNFSDGQLWREMQMRGLAPVDEGPEDDLLLDDEDLDEGFAHAIPDFSYAREERE
jgi:hypothetical protein